MSAIVGNWIWNRRLSLRFDRNGNFEFRDRHHDFIHHNGKYSLQGNIEINSRHDDYGEMFLKLEGSNEKLSSPCGLFCDLVDRNYDFLLIDLERLGFRPMGTSADFASYL